MLQEANPNYKPTNLIIILRNVRVHLIVNIDDANNGRFEILLEVCLYLHKADKKDSLTGASPFYVICSRSKIFGENFR